MTLLDLELPELPTEPDPDWKSRGACKGADPTIWFPSRGEDLSTAKGICAGCPVREECLEYSITNNEQFGVWGGLSERERKKLRRARRAAGTLPPRQIVHHHERIIRHGTPAGYRQHYRLGQQPCTECLAGRIASNNPEGLPTGGSLDRSERALVDAGWCHRCVAGNHHQCHFCACPTCHPAVRTA